MESIEPGLNSEQITEYTQHYNQAATGRSLRDFVLNEGIAALVAGMLTSIVQREGKLDMLSDIGPLIMESLSVGIWLAEIGQTRMLEKREGLQ